MLELMVWIRSLTDFWVEFDPEGLMAARDIVSSVRAELVGPHLLYASYLYGLISREAENRVRVRRLTAPCR